MNASTVDGNLVLTAPNSTVNINGALVTDPVTIQAASINIGANVTAPGGIVFVSSNDIKTTAGGLTISAANGAGA
ncbi:hypothetical protein ABTK02_22225, partial [Acinetobacter baumannii]